MIPDLLKGPQEVMISMTHEGNHPMLWGNHVCGKINVSAEHLKWLPILLQMQESMLHKKYMCLYQVLHKQI